jgi:FkbM family methyltransferase
MTPFVLREQGDWFEAEIHFIRSFLRPGMAVVDVGANYGMYTITSAKAVGKEGRVWSYEPASLPRSCLTRSLADNHLDNVQLANTALSDHIGVARLGIAANAELNSLNETGQSGEEVPLTTLDTECLRWDRPIDLLKLDAEGEEVRILSAAKQFFARNSPLVMFEYKHGNKVNDGLLRAVTDLGMRLYRHLPGPNVLVPLSDSSEVDDYLLNVFGCDSKRAQELADRGLLVEADVELPVIDVHAAEATMANWFAARPWAPSFQDAGLFAYALEDSIAYYASLAEVLKAEDVAISPAERVSRLRRGFANLLASINSDCNAGRLLSAARVAMDLGERAASVTFLQEAQRLLAAAGDANLGAALPEAFLPPHRRHDDLAPGPNSVVTSLFAMIDEPLLERVAFSVYFLGRSAEPIIQRLAANPLHSPAIERRIATARQAFA